MSEAARAESSADWKSASVRGDGGGGGGGGCLRWSYTKGRHEGPKAGKRWSAQRKAAAAAAAAAAEAAGHREDSPVAGALLVETESVKTEWECVYSNPEDLDVRRSHRHRKVKLPFDIGALQNQRKKKSKKMKENIKVTLKISKEEVTGERPDTESGALAGHTASLKPYVCQECGKEFRQSNDLFRHQTLHTGERPLKCGACGKAFALQADLNRHAIIHTEQRPYACQECGKAFRWSQSLVHHRRSHSDVREFQCEGCGKDFKHRRTLMQHRKTNCAAAAPPLADGDDRRRRQQPRDDFQMNPSEFPKRKAIAVHRSHSRGSAPALKKFLCQDCGKGFRQATDLVRHRSLHTGERNALCGVCGKGFALQSDLARHRRTHDPSSGSRYPCSSCGRLFSCRRSATLHESAHSRPPQPAQQQQRRRGAAAAAAAGGGGRRNDEEVDEEEGRRRLARASKRDGATAATMRLQPV